MNRKTIFVSLLFLSTYLIRLQFAIPPAEVLSDKFVGERVVLKGIIASEPDERDNTTHYILEPEGEEWSYKILITADRFPELQYGDLVEVKGGIEFPKNFNSDLGREFDYKNYLAKDGIRYVSYKPQISVLEKDKGSKFFSALFSFKKFFVKNVEAVLSEPYSSLALGITIGLKQSLGEELLEVFREAGIIHIVVLSGYNMTIILAGAFYLLSRFRRNFALAAAALLTVGFALLVGLSATVLRASIMALLAILARFLGRPVLALRALMVAGLAMVLWNPLTLFYDPSFQLSFLATFSLITVSPLVERRLREIPKFSKIFEGDSKIKSTVREITIATVSTQLFVLPALIYMTGQVSIISLVVNILVLPLIPYAMAFSALAGVCGSVSILVSKFFALPAYVILSFVIGVSEVAVKVPFASISIKFFPLWLVFFCYLCYIFILYKNLILQAFHRMKQESVIER